jgi:hypothetical protein
MIESQSSGFCEDMIPLAPNSLSWISRTCCGFSRESLSLSETATQPHSPTTRMSISTMMYLLHVASCVVKQHPQAQVLLPTNIMSVLVVLIMEYVSAEG